MQKNNQYSGLHGLLLLVLGTIMLTLLSCGGKVPKKYIQPSAMEDILYDYHMLQSMKGVLEIDSQMSKAYLQTVFDKYDITQAEFDSSMVFYLRHTYMLQEIYENLSVRIEKEAVAQGADGGSFDFSGGDTANVWRLEKARVFSAQPPYNVMQFTIPVDTAFKAGDKLLLTFNSDFLCEMGNRNGLAVMSVKLKNDSVITRTVIITGQSKQQMEIFDSERVGIKTVQGFFMQKESHMATDRNSPSLRMMVISDIKLIRMHVPELPKTQTTMNADSTGVARPDTVNPQPGVSPPPTDSPKEFKPGEPAAVPATSTPVEPLDRPVRGVGIKPAQPAVVKN